ncbi:sulfotransferase 1A1-like [Mya arenaria]|uniref:sulfotransferase 1A1-like n=1 Tax=Mya arenaria TaxID=6604 RepID=UPI0022E47CDA|nr:sulfotransferase 1A1-like [Mya arenaria]
MTSKLTVEKPDGGKIETIFAKGISYWSGVEIPGDDLHAHIDKVLNLDIRDDDIYLATYPKAGTHWMWEIIQMLLKGIPEYDKRVKESAFLDFRPPETVNSIPSPRVLNCHYPVTLTPKRVISKGIKIIHVQRNFKDICVSAFHHLKTFKLYGAETFDDFLPIMIGSYGIHFFCSWAEYVRGWERFTNDNPGDVLNIYFEDLKEDPVREIAKVDKFLETGQDEGMFKQIAEACHFTNMKKANKEIKENNFNTEVDMYRKGEVGDWKNWFTVAQSERVDQWLEENMLGSQLNFRDAL